ncbi:hypothetical protein L9F63_001275, partial [Diploptera punctata]
AVVVAFFICWAPFHAQRLLAVYALNNATAPNPVLVTVYKTLTYTSGVLYYMSTTVNPVLYHIMSNKFREAFKTTLAQPCGWNRKNANKRRTYSVLNYQQINRNASNQQNYHQQLQRLHSNQIQRSRINSLNGNDVHKVLYNTTPIDEKNDKKIPHSDQAIQKQYSNRNSDSIEEDQEQSIALIENKLQGKTLPNDSSTDTITSNSYAMYTYRPRIPSNSSQATLTTSLGKISLSEGNNNCRPETIHSTSEETKLHDATISSNGCIPKKYNNIGNFSAHISIDSGKSTISNSSLQDLDETEFVGAELAHYMACVLCNLGKL